MVNLVVCADGTWQGPKDTKDGVPTPSNVHRIFGAIDEPADQKYYHSGVGTDGGPVRRLLGGSVGLGLDDNIKSAYKWLGTVYQPGDRLFLFGFSRGAYTVRSLAGMIGRLGLLDLVSDDPDTGTMWERVDKVFGAYRKPEDEGPPDLPKYRYFNVEPGGAPGGSVPVHFLGVWDTVGSLGIPDEFAILDVFDDPAKHSFHDARLGEVVTHARHAVAIDEQRKTFTPTLWTDVAPERDVKQVWFPGVHTDIGGGYRDHSLADNTLHWMIDEAANVGLRIKAGARAQLGKANAHGLVHNSVTGFFKALSTRPRSVPNFDDEVPGKVLHETAIVRRADAPLAQPDYWQHIDLKPNEEARCDIYAGQKWNRTHLYLREGATYRFAAMGQWLDSSVKCSPAGPVGQGSFGLGSIFKGVGNGLGRIERILNRNKENARRDLWFTRREEEHPWFSLIGTVANGGGASGSGGVIPHESFLIGDGLAGFSPHSSGFLYAFANDAWLAYGNNRGSVSLTVRRLD